MMNLRRFYSNKLFNMESVKVLKDKTGFSLAQCHKALLQFNGDSEAAFNHLHQTVNTSSSNTAHDATQLCEGLVGIFGENSVSPLKKRLLRLRCRTDFAANSSAFQDTFTKLGNFMIQHESDDPKVPEEVENLIKNLSTQIREPVLLDSSDLLFKASESTSLIGQYIHAKVNPFMGRAAALIEVQRDTQTDSDIAQLANKLACHIVGMKPTNMEELLGQDYLFDETINIQRLVKENDIRISRFKCISVDSE